MTRSKQTGGALCALVLLCLASSCDSSVTPGLRAARLGAGCLLHSDCESPLVCAFERCHRECRSNRDCLAGERCVAAEGALLVCQLPDEQQCRYNSECAPDLVCAVDMQCRNECRTFRDCVPGQKCVGGTCADEAELVDGGLEPRGGRAGGSPCEYHSDCPLPLVCLRSRCRIECLEDRDCVPGFACRDNRCGPRTGTPQVDADSGSADADSGTPDGGSVADGAVDATSSGGNTGMSDAGSGGTGPSDAASGGAGGTSDAGNDDGGPACEPQTVGPECAPRAGGTATELYLPANGFHTCVLLDNGNARCWGGNGDGRLGYGDLANIGDDEAGGCAGDISVGGAVAKLSPGATHTCALRTDGNVLCWGRGAAGQLGYGNTESIGDDELPSTAGPVALGQRAIDVSVGREHTCAVLEDATVRCWGKMTTLAGLTIDYGSSPSVVNVGVPVREIHCSSGLAFNCVVTETNTVRCWGGNWYGQLGYGNTADRTLPPGDVDLGGTVTRLSVGSGFSCALLTGGGARCWGNGAYGQLGYPGNTHIGDNEVPASLGDVPLGAPLLDIAAGGEHTCALLSGGRIRCWGNNRFGQLGYGNTDVSVELPMAGNVDVGGTVTRIRTGASHSCALLDTGAVRCWGIAHNGALGYGNTCVVGDDETPASAGDVPYR